MNYGEAYSEGLWLNDFVCLQSVNVLNELGINRQTLRSAHKFLEEAYVECACFI